MDIAVLVCSIIAALGTMFSFLMWHDSKGNIIKKIEKKENKINKIQTKLNNKYGLWYSERGPLDPLEIKKRKLQSEVDYLKKLL